MKSMSMGNYTINPWLSKTGPFPGHSRSQSGELTLYYDTIIKSCRPITGTRYFSSALGHDSLLYGTLSVFQTAKMQACVNILI